ncbi:MAG: hypothetical protein ACIAQF_07305 [Phycisphaerales bacterium JB065]
MHTRAAIEREGGLLGALNRGSTLNGLSGAFLSVACDETELRVDVYGRELVAFL